MFVKLKKIIKQVSVENSYNFEDVKSFIDRYLCFIYQST